MNEEIKEVYKVGECPACIEPVLLLKVKGDERLVSFCPLCEAAWRSPPPENQLDEVLSIDEVAPGGVQLPSRNEVERAGYVDVEVIPASEWRQDLEPLLKSD